MKRRTFCISAAAAVGGVALPFGHVFAAVSSVTADVAAVTGDGRKILLRASDVEDFRAGMRASCSCRAPRDTTTRARSSTGCSIAVPR